VPITLNCACGKVLRVPDSAAGKRAKCPACAAVLDVPAPPAPEPVFEIVEPAPLPEAVPPPVYAPKPPAVHADDDDDQTAYGLAPEEKDETTGSNGAPKAPKRGLPNFRKGGSNYS
jgi:hypothetical protein